MARRLFPLFLLATIPSAVRSLTCYVCATGNLGEFGECKEQFQYDCTPYASKFPGERTYCRTTREKQQNGSFSVMKECISETDHYSRFPEKGYTIDEECDLVDVQGQEVAYCVCRTPLCNREQIAEQFMAFENKHPELFGDAEESQESQEALPDVLKGPVPLALPKKPSAAFAAPQVVPPAIVPVNDPRFSVPSSPDVRRQPQQVARPQLPSREGAVNTGMFTLPKGPPVSQSGFVGSVPLGRDPAISVPQNPEPPRPVAPPVVPEAPAVPIVPALQPVARPGPPTPPPKPALRCAQCGERGLMDLNSDCSRMTVSECTEPDAICFTRMIGLDNGQHAVEKMCVGPESVRSMFGDGAVNGECGTASQGREHYCTCTTNECNRAPLHEQRGLRSPVPPPAPPPTAPIPVPEMPAPVPEPKVERPPPPPPRQPTPQPVKELPIPEVPRPQPAIQRTPEPKVEEPPKPIVPAVVNHARKKADLRCSTCHEEGITDPTADCSASATRDCREGQTMCITQQTQVDNEFRMEKRCISSEEFSKVISTEPFEEGCATADEGMINFCLCKGEKCNAPSLLSQAQSNGVRDSLEQARHQTQSEEKNEVEDLPKVPIREPPREQLPAIASGIPTHHESNDNRIEHHKEKSPEELELELRRQKWAEADLNSSSSSLLSLLLLFIVALLP